MTLQPARNDVGQDYRNSVHTPRLRLKSKAPHSGSVDGAWWPRSDDLSAELPDLLAVLSVRLGRIDRVLYGLHEWSTVPTKFVKDARSVRLDGYRGQPVHTVEVLGLNRSRMVLLVVPPHTEPLDAHTTMMAVMGPNNASTVDGLLGISARDRKTRSEAVAARESWESEGGSQMFADAVD